MPEFRVDIPLRLYFTGKREQIDQLVLAVQKEMRLQFGPRSEIIEPYASIEEIQEDHPRVDLMTAVGMFGGKGKDLPEFVKTALVDGEWPKLDLTHYHPADFGGRLSDIPEVDVTPADWQPADLPAEPVAEEPVSVAPIADADPIDPRVPLSTRYTMTPDSHHIGKRCGFCVMGLTVNDVLIDIPVTIPGMLGGVDDEEIEQAVHMVCALKAGAVDVMA